MAQEDNGTYRAWFAFFPYPLGNRHRGNPVKEILHLAKAARNNNFVPLISTPKFPSWEFH